MEFRLQAEGCRLCSLPPEGGVSCPVSTLMYTLFVALPVFLAQFFLEDFARAAFRQRVKEFNRFGNLEPGQAAATMRGQFFFGERLIGLQYDQRLRYLAPFFIRDSNH